MADSGRRLLIREASKTGETAAVLKERLRLVISVRRIRKILKETCFLKFNKMQRAPLLTKEHRAARVNFAKQQLKWNSTKWRRVILTEEEKFNLDGPDGLACYWYQEGTEVLQYKAARGCFFNGLGAISYYGAADLIRVKGARTPRSTAKHCSTVRYHLRRTFWEEIGRYSRMTPLYTAQSTRKMDGGQKY